MVDSRGETVPRNRKDDDFNWNFDSRMNIPGLKRQLRSNQWYIEARWCTFVIELGFCRLACSILPSPRERFGKLDRRYSIESSGYRRLITEKWIGSINDSCLPPSTRWGISRSLWDRKNGQGNDATIGKWSLFIYLIFTQKKKKKEKPRKLRGGRARNNGAVGSVPGISRCGVMNRVVV